MGVFYMCLLILDNAFPLVSSLHAKANCKLWLHTISADPRVTSVL